MVGNQRCSSSSLLSFFPDKKLQVVGAKHVSIVYVEASPTSMCGALYTLLASCIAAYNVGLSENKNTCPRLGKLNKERPNSPEPQPPRHTRKNSVNFTSTRTVFEKKGLRWTETNEINKKNAHHVWQEPRGEREQETNSKIKYTW